jgi:hypothetical protein
MRRKSDPRTRPGYRDPRLGGVRPRRVEVRRPRESLLIVCEGAQTERRYFEAFPVPADVYVWVVGTGMNTESLVEYARQLRGQATYDQVWCVFDHDSFTEQQFNDAIGAALRAGMRVAYSCEAFELWYLLHFAYHDAQLSRSQYEAKLSECLGRPYRKNDPEMYRLLLPRQSGAIRNAALLLDRHAVPPTEVINPPNPCTTVHLLVQELNRLAAPPNPHPTESG